METSLVIPAITLIAKGLEISGVAVIGISFLFVIVRGFIHVSQKKEDSFKNCRISIGKALQLGLEFLVAADIIRTVTISPTMESILLLGLLVAIRTILSWSITVEIEGCWPWQIWLKK